MPRQLLWGHIPLFTKSFLHKTLLRQSHVSQAGLELTMELSHWELLILLRLPPQKLRLQTHTTTASFILCWELNPKLCACQAGTLPTELQLQPNLVLGSYCFSLLNARIISVHHQAWFYLMLGIEPRASCVLVKPSTNWATTLAFKVTMFTDEKLCC